MVTSIYILNLSLAYVGSRAYTSKCDYILLFRLVPKPDFKEIIIFKVVWCYPNICLSPQYNSVSFQPLLPSVFMVVEWRVAFFQ